MGRNHQREPLSHVAMFWLLASMGTATALPCLLVPPTEALRELAAVEAVELARVEQLEEAVAHQRRLDESLRRDPQTNLRLAQRELGYRVPGTMTVHRTVPGEALLPPPPAPPPGAAMPEWIDTLYPQQWASAYRAERTRHMILFGALSLIVIAFALYKPRRVM